MNEITLTKEQMRGILCKAETAIAHIPGAMFDDCFPLKHEFADGIYVRQIFIPAGYIIATKLFRQAHATFLTQGECSVMNENGVTRLKAPFQMITPAGAKRVIYTHTDIMWTTVHANPTNTKDLKQLEKEIISPSYEELEIDYTMLLDDIKKE